MAEDHKERVDRELIELLNEMRVVLPGAQVLFAFLLVLPFTPRIESRRRPARRLLRRLHLHRARHVACSWRPR